jgi:HEAT repeat protein
MYENMRFQAVVDQAEIHRMARSEDVEERREAVKQLRKNFADFPDKKQAWDDLIRLTSDTDNSMCWRAADALGSVISLMLDKKQAWDDLIRLTSANHIDVRGRAAFALGRAFAYMADKNQAWDDLHRLTSNNHSEVRGGDASAIGYAFLHVPDKNQAWNDLIRLISDADRSVLIRATSALSSAFLHIPDKKQAWDDLIRLASDNDSDVIWGAASALGIGFSLMPDKNQAWDDLHRLTSHNYIFVRDGATYALGIAFLHIPDKNKAWEDLHRLTSDYHSLVRESAADAIGSAFSHIPDKQQAWDDLLRLTSDTDSDVRWRAASALGSAFVNVPDKKEAWKDLLRLTKDKYYGVQAFAYHSLGIASIFKATETESKDNFRKELEKAIEFFETSSKITFDFNPASFCLPFYRSFYTLTFKEEDAEAEVKRYLAEAESAVVGSHNKKKLLEAVENLENALKEVQKARDFDDVKSDLKAYKRYLDHACELLDTAEEKALGASRLIRKGMPIIDERITGIIAEIQETAKVACQQSLGTQVEEIACAANKAIQKWYIDDQEQMTMAVENVILSISIKIPNIIENKRIFDKIEEIRNEKNMNKQYQGIAVLVALIPTLIVHKGDVINVSGITTSDNSQTIIKGTENTNNPVKSSTFGLEPAKKTWIDVLNSSATVAAFAGFIAVEIGTYFYPLSYNHLISVIAAAIIFTIVALLSRR